MAFRFAEDTNPYCFVNTFCEDNKAEIVTGIYSPTQTQVLIKHIPPQNQIDPELLSSFINAVEIQQTIDHPYILPLFDAVQTPNGYYSFSEFCENGSLANYIKRKGSFQIKLAKKIFLQIILALDYLHNQKQIFLRNLNLDNIFLDKNENVRLSSFESATFRYNLSGQKEPQNPNQIFYLAPESINSNCFEASSEIWSAGVILYTMVCGDFPFQNFNTSLLRSQITSIEPQYPIKLSRDLVDLLKRLLTKNPNERISLAGILQHPWIYGLKIKYDDIIHKFYSDNLEMNRNIYMSMKKNQINSENLSQNTYPSNNITFKILKREYILSELSPHLLHKIRSSSYLINDPDSNSSTLPLPSSNLFNRITPNTRSSVNISQKKLPVPIYRNPINISYGLPKKPTKLKKLDLINQTKCSQKENFGSFV